MTYIKKIGSREFLTSQRSEGDRLISIPIDSITSVSLVRDGTVTEVVTSGGNVCNVYLLVKEVMHFFEVDASES